MNTTSRTRAAAVIYPIAWITGLSIFDSSTSVTSSGQQTLRSLTGNASLAATQTILTEGIAGIALGFVVLALSAGSTHRRRPLIAATGLVAALISLVQCAIGWWMTTSVASSGDANHVATLTRLLNELDGVKMGLLAILCAAAAAQFPHWLRWTSAACGAALAVSAVGYLAASDVLAYAAWVSLPLLIIVITAGGILASKAHPRPDRTPDATSPLPSLA